MPRNYTVKEIADILGFSTNSIYSFLKEKRINGVRVGRGRFRIPEEELARILHLSKKPAAGPITVTPQEALPLPPITHIGDDAIIERAEEKAFRIKGLATRIHFPNIFDWFVGISSVTSGLGLFLFNISFEPETAQAFVAFLPAVRVILIFGGIGVIVSSLTDRGAWRKVFLTILMGLGLLYVRMFARSGDSDGAMIYGSLVLIIGLHAWFRTGGVVSLVWYLLAVLAAFPISLYSPDNAPAVALLGDLGVSRNAAAALLGLAAVVSGTTIWVGYSRVRALFWVGSWMAAAVSFVFALLLFYLMFWSRGYFLATLAFFAAMLPVWRNIQLEGSRRQQILMHIVFVVVGLFIAVTTLAIRQLQANAWIQNEAEFKNKTTYAVSRVRDALTNVTRSLEATAASPTITRAVRKKNVDQLTDIARVILESNTEIRRVVVLDETGEAMLLYPLGSFDDNNLTYREYFMHVRDTGRSYVSHALQSQNSGRTRYVVVVAVPMTDEAGKLLGVLVGSMDIEKLGLELQKIVVGSLGEYVLLVDGEGRRIVHPDPFMVGEELPAGDAIQLTPGAAMPQVKLGIIAERRQGIISSATIPETQWTVSLRAPVSRVYRLTFRSSLLLVAVIGLVLFLTAFLMLLLNRRVRRFVLDGGS